MNEEHNRPVVSFIDDARIDNTVEKISAVLSKHYSLHEADWLCRIITDPKKNQQDILEAMKEIERAYEADEELVMDDNEDEDLTLTKADARTFYDLQNALEQKYPEGVTIGVESFKTDDIFSYIQFGQFRDSSLELAGLGEEVPATADTLQAEVRVPKDEICRLSASQEYYCNESYEDFINELDDSEAYDASTTELMHCHPDLKGAKLVMYDALLPKKLYVEGHPVDECVAWMLQSSLFNEQELSRVLHEPEYAAATMDEIRKCEMSEYDRNRIAKMNLPLGMDMVKNPERMYFFEKGVLGFAEVDRMRGVRYSGETMSREGQDFINDFVAKKNIEQRQHQTFFITPGVGSELKAYLDTMKNKLVKVDVQQDIYGRTMFTDGTKILSEGVMQHFQDITGRITEAVIVGIDKPMVRCKIDGEQQSGSLLNKAQRIMYASHMDNAESRKKFAESMAVAHFATALYDSPEQSRNKGMGR